MPSTRKLALGAMTSLLAAGFAAASGTDGCGGAVGTCVQAASNDAKPMNKTFNKTFFI
jgi:hypothetical protein